MKLTDAMTNVSFDGQVILIVHEDVVYSTEENLLYDTIG